MIEEAKLTLYRITRCGYYRGLHKTPEFGTVSDLLDQYMGWAKAEGRALADTCTYQIEEGSDLLKTYCVDMIKDRGTGDFMLTTWNETPTNRGRVASVQGNKPVGHVDVHFDQPPKGAIPGYATYFWFLPEKRMFATVRFQHVLNGHEGMTKLLREYMGKFAKYVVCAEDPQPGADIEIIGYAEHAGDDPLSLVPKFRTELFKKQSELDQIASYYPVVRKLIRKNLLVSANPEDLQVWQQLLARVGLSNPAHRDEMAIKFEVPYHPTKAELQAIIDEWAENHDSKWDDVGFQLKGDANQVLWLSHTIAKTTRPIDVKRDNDEVVNSESLLAALLKLREVIVSLTTATKPSVKSPNGTKATAK